jgi:hypothetical protein
MVDGLSTYTLRAHCIIYASVLRQKRRELNAMKKWLLLGRGVTVVFDDVKFRSKMDFMKSEDATGAMEHAFISLNAHDLCQEGLQSFGGSKFFGTHPIRWMHLSLRGVELFCWGNGFGQMGIDAYFERNLMSDAIRALSIRPKGMELGHVSYGPR